MRLPTNSMALLIVAGLAVGASALATVLLPGALAQDSAASSSEPSAAPTDTIAEPDPLAGADIERGKKVYATISNCTRCHGWDGDGLGRGYPGTPGDPAKLRESTLDPATMIEVVSCGLPGTAMPYHDSQSYKDDRCYGMVASDFEQGLGPVKGRTVGHADIVNVVAYVVATLQGKPKATYDDCAAYFGASAEKACAFLKE